MLVSHFSLSDLVYFCKVYKNMALDENETDLEATEFVKTTSDSVCSMLHLGSGTIHCVAGTDRRGASGHLPHGAASYRQAHYIWYSYRFIVFVRSSISFIICDVAPSSALGTDMATAFFWRWFCRRCLSIAPSLPLFFIFVHCTLWTSASRLCGVAGGFLFEGKYRHQLQGWSWRWYFPPKRW